VLALRVDKGKAAINLRQLVDGRRLAPGRYRVLVQAFRTADGAESWAYAVKFWVLRPAKTPRR
jgi:hypothetical protein